MTALEWLIVFHLVLFAYWLGGDLGVFYSSRYVMKPTLSPEARATALKIMVWVDMCPRICLVLFLPSGVSLMAASEYGEVFRWWPLVAVWVFSLAWLGLVLADHHYEGTPRGARIKSLDLLVRLGVAFSLIGAGIYTVVVSEPFGVTTNPKWLGIKVALYAVTILCGIAIRYALKPFGPGFMAVMTSGSSPAAEAAVTGSIKRAEPFVFAIWTLVVVVAALGVIQPGATL